MNKDLKENLSNLLFILPLLTVFALVIVYPFLYVIQLSFFKESLSGELTYVGLKNYLKIFSDPDFVVMLKNTFWWTFGGVFLKVGMGLILALVLYEQFKLKKFFLFIVLIPWAIPYSISHIAWRWMYNALYGHINSLLLYFHLVAKPPEWLANPNFSLWGVLVANSWTGFPFCAFAILSGLYAIPTHLFEAADIDGANSWQCFHYITFPLIRPVLLLVSALTAIWTFNNFGAVWLMTQGGPVNSSTTLIVDIYRYAFEFNKPGYAYALSVLSAVFLIGLTSFYVFFNRKEELS